jgi:hypothetical protein
MKIVSWMVGAAALLQAGVANADQIRTTFTDVHGTRFLVSVDWDDRTASATLLANPANLRGAELEERLQVAVWYGATTYCSIHGDNQISMSQSTVSGRLDCPWFNEAMRMAGN